MVNRFLKYHLVTMSRRIFLPVFLISSLFLACDSAAQNTAPQLVFAEAYAEATWNQVGRDIYGGSGDWAFSKVVDLSADGSRVMLSSSFSDFRRSQERQIRYADVYIWQLPRPINGDDISVNNIAFSGDGHTIVFSVSRYPDGWNSTGSFVRIMRFEQSSSSWNQIGEDFEGDEGTDRLEISADGNTIIFGFPKHDHNGMNSGLVRIYHYDQSATAWTQLGQDIHGENEGDQVGNYVALSADGLTALIGASEGSTRAFSFESESNSWSRLGQSLGPGRGIALSSDGRTAVAGQKSFRFDQETNSWKELQKGRRLSLDKLSANGRMAIFGDPWHEIEGNDSVSGRVGIFHYSPFSDAWTQVGQEIEAAGYREMYLGEAVAISADGHKIAFVSTSDDLDSDSIQAQVYELSFPSAISFSVPEHTTTITDIDSLDDVDAEGFGISYSLSGADASLFSINSDGILSFVSPPAYLSPSDSNFDNIYEINVATTDSQSESSEMSLAIRIFHSQPQILGLSDITLRQGQSHSLKLALVDPDTSLDVLDITAASDNQQLISDSALVLAGSGQIRSLTINPISGQLGTSTISVTVRDGTNIVTKTFTIIVENSAPRLILTGGSAANTWAQLGQSIDSEHLGDGAGDAVALSADGLTAIIGARWNSDSGPSSGHARIFRFNQVTNSWVQLGQDIDGEDSWSYSGTSVALSADGLTAIIGAPLNEGCGIHSGHARVFRFHEGTNSWYQVGQDLDAARIEDRFGSSVGLSANGLIAIVGATENHGCPDEDYGFRSGYTRIFHFDELTNSWKRLGQDLRGSATNDFSGTSVALSADGFTAIIGAPGSDRIGEDFGRSRVFRFGEIADSWTQFGMTIGGDAAGDTSGSSVALSANGLAAMIGAPGNDGNGNNSGHTRIYRIEPGSSSWTQLGQDIRGNEVGMRFGSSVALSADGLTALVNSPQHNNNGPRSLDQARLFHFDQLSASWHPAAPPITGTAAVRSIALSADGLTAMVGENQTRIWRLAPRTNYDITGSNRTIIDIQASDDSDSEGSGLNYSLTGVDAAQFSINSEGLLRFIDTPDFQTPHDFNSDNVYEVTVVATDSQSASSQRALTITVLNNKPTLSGTTDITISPNQTYSMALTLSELDPSTETLTLAASSSNQSVIDDSTLTFTGTGVTRFLSLSPLEGQLGTSIITVTLDDGLNTMTQTFTVTVENTPPHLTLPRGRLVGGTWTQLGHDIDGEEAIDMSGDAVALSADGLTAIIGSPKNNATGTDSGHTRIFRFDHILNTWTQLGQTIDGEGKLNSSGASVALSADGLTAIVGAPHGDSNEENSGHARIFRLNQDTNTWLQLGQNINGKASDDEFGTSVALSANGLIAIIGGPQNDDRNHSAGHAQVFRFEQDTNSWIQLGRDIYGAGQNDKAGTSVDLSVDGLIAIVGAPGHDRNGRGPGHARVFRFAPGAGSWMQLGQDIDGSDLLDQFGVSVALNADGLTAIIGAPGDDENDFQSGQARIFRFHEVTNSWIQLGQDINGELRNGETGYAVALSADGLTAIIGTIASDRRTTGTGHTQVFRFNQQNDSWNQLGLGINGEAQGDVSGSSVALSAAGLTAVIGAPHNRLFSLKLPISTRTLWISWLILRLCSLP